MIARTYEDFRRTIVLHVDWWDAGRYERLWGSDMALNLEIDMSSAAIEYRPVVGERCTEAARDVRISALLSAVPHRTFTWYVGQRNYPGLYWAVTERAHVGYESRLELAALMACDFAPEVSRIKAQPFLLTVMIDGRVNRHTPDILLATDEGPVIVDVVRRDRLQVIKIQRLLQWTRAVTKSLSWDYRIMSEPPQQFLANLRFLAGYRREETIDRAAMELVRVHAHDLAGMRIDDAEKRLSADRPTPMVRAALLHALWSGLFRVDLYEQLQPSTVLEMAEHNRKD